MLTITFVEDVLRKLGAFDDEHIQAFVVTGSLASGQQDEDSDVDIEIIYKEAALVPLVIEDASCKWDISHFALNDFPGIDKAHWNAASYVTAQVLKDEDGAVRRRIQDLITLTEEEMQRVIPDRLDCYYNGFYRSIKALMRNNAYTAHVMACESMQALGGMLSALNGRITTYPTRLCVTIGAMPSLPLPSEELYALMERVAVYADGPTQYRLFTAVVAWMQEKGWGHIHDGWNGEIIARYQLFERASARKS